MHNLKTIIRNWVKAFLYPKPLIGIIYLPRFFYSLIKYSLQSKKEKVSFGDLQPCLGDWTTHTPFDTHYFYQGAWLSRKLVITNPKEHIDIGSSALTMSVLSATVNTVFVDYRPLKVTLPGLTSIAGDILNLPFETNTVDSLSCLHVIEHIGLGRYGDPIDPDGSIKAALELQRILHAGGKLYLSLPIGRERICFNAHRVHAPETVVSLFPKLKLIEFSFVNDEGQFLEKQQLQTAKNLDYGCGLFMFEKI
jgi:SAM-dependent methyltransferase